MMNYLFLKYVYLVCDAHKALEWKPDNANKIFSQIFNKEEHSRQVGFKMVLNFISKMEKEMEFRKNEK